MNKKQPNSNIKTPSPKKKRVTISLIIIMIISLIIPLFFLFSSKPSEVTYKEFQEKIKQEKVEEVRYDVSNKNLEFVLKDNKNKVYKAPNPRDENFKKEMLEKGIKVEEASLSPLSDILGPMLMLFLQYAIIFGVFIFSFRSLQQGDEGVEIEDVSQKTFDDVAGLKEVKSSLMSIVDMLKHPKKYEEVGARIPKGILLYGPPGTGKTLIAKAIAGEANINFLAVSGSDFDNKFVGVGAEKVRKLFKKATKLAPCIIFIDEIDSIGGRRSSQDKAFERQSLTQLLSSMDGFSTKDNICVIAATNDKDSLDPALLRTGRFDSHFAVGIPTNDKDREDIINLYLKNKKVNDDVSISILAKQTLGCSPSDIEAIINEAAIESVKNGGLITQKNFDNAFYKHIVSGHKKEHYERDLAQTKMVAYHEAGHALVGHLEGKEVLKVSIVPTTSGAGGLTLFAQDKIGMFSKKELESHVKMLYGGRNAEIILNGSPNVSTGASNDIEQATKCIKDMVNLYGMSSYGSLNLDLLNLPGEEVVNEYIKKSRELEEASLEILQNNRKLLDDIAQVLIEKETIDTLEFLSILNK